LQDAIEKRGARVAFADATQLTACLGAREDVKGSGITISEWNLLLACEIPGGSLEQVIFRMDALHQVENAGLRVVNSPYAIEKMVDKYYTLSLLQQAGLHVPETRITEDFSQAMEAFQALGRDVVVKPLFGSRGIGMVRVTDEDTAGRVFHALQLGGYVYYVQQFLLHDNRDLRVMVVGGQCIAAMERVADTWKTNLAAGAKPVRSALSPDVQDICLQASRTLGADYCGVDLLRDESGELFILEVNSMPAWQGLQQVTPFNIADRIAEHCLSLVKNN
jgi:RimK family alpha-L-glutamate ligase